MRRFDVDRIYQLKNKIKTVYDDTTEATNTLAVDSYNMFLKISEEVSIVSNKVAVMGDMLTDLRILNGSAQNIIYLSDLPTVESNGISINNDTFELAKLKSNLREINASLSSISNTSSYIVKSLNGKPADVLNFFKTEEPIQIIFPAIGYTCNLNLQYDSYEQINTIAFSLGLGTDSYPIISSIKYVDINNNLVEAVILNNNSRNIDLNEFRVKDNSYIINLNSIVTNSIIIELSDRFNNSVILKNIKTYYNTTVDSGFIILGPIQSNDPILKVGIDSVDNSDGVSIEISLDKEFWLPLESSSSLIVDDAKKIISFNTINTLSLKTDENVRNIYVKINIESTEVTEEDLPISIYNTIREDATVNNSTLALVEDNRFSAYRIRNSSGKYGGYTFINTTNPSKMLLSKLDTIDLNGSFKVLGLIDSKLSITKNSQFASNVGLKLKHLRLPAEKILDARKYDISNSTLLDIYVRYLDESINCNYKENLCFVLKEKEDVYKIISEVSKKSIDIDVTTPFSKNSSNMLINVPFENIIIKNSIGELVKYIKKEDLYTLTEKEFDFKNSEEITLYFVNLLNILYEPILVENFTPSYLYPIKELAENEYGLKDGKIVTIKDKILNIKGYELISNKVDCIKTVNYKNGNHIKRLDDSFTYYHEQIEQISEPKTIIKLDKVSIEKGTLNIYEYLDGLGEQYESEGTSTIRYLNVGTTIEPKYIQTDESDLNIYLQE